MNVPSPISAADGRANAYADVPEPDRDLDLQAVIASLAAIVDFRRAPVIIQIAGVTEREPVGDIAWNLACGVHERSLGRVCLLELLEDNRGRLLPVGDAPPLELSVTEFGGLIQGRLRRFAEQCADRFEIIFVNSGPVLVSGQANLTARQVDGVILVLESERTRMPDAKLARSMLEKAEANLLGVVVTGRRRRLERWLRPLRSLLGA